MGHVHSHGEGGPCWSGRELTAVNQNGRANHAQQEALPGLGGNQKSSALPWSGTPSPAPATVSQNNGCASGTHQAALPGSRVEAAGLHRAHTCCPSLTQAWLWAARTVGRYHRHTTLPPGPAHAHPTPTSLRKPPGLHRHPFPQGQFFKTGREKLYHLPHRNKRKSQRKTNEIEKICLIKNLKELL